MCSSTAFASGFLARAAPEANEATFAPCVETKNNPQRADADGLKSAMRALGDRRVKRPRPARSRTCTLDSLHVCLSHALDARSDALPRRLSLRARRSRAVRRACFFPPRDGTNAVLRGSRARRAVRRDVPCVPRRCTQPELVPSESPVSSLRADDVRRVAFWRSLHFQFYTWYFHAMPLLLWRAPLPTSARLAVLAALEFSFSYWLDPVEGTSTPLSSAVLQLAHAVAPFVETRRRVGRRRRGRGRELARAGRAREGTRRARGGHVVGRRRSRCAVCGQRRGRRRAERGLAATSDDEHAQSTLTLGPRNAKTKDTRPETTETKEPTASYVDVRADEEETATTASSYSRLATPTWTPTRAPTSSRPTSAARKARRC